MITLFASLVWAQDCTSEEAEIAALRAAVTAFQTEAETLRAANADLQQALALKQQALESTQSAVLGYQGLLTLKDEVIAAEVALRIAAEKRGDVFEKLATKNQVTPVERVVWAGALVVVGGLGLYGALSPSPVTVQLDGP